MNERNEIHEIRAIKSAALIGLGAIGAVLAPRLKQVLGDENFRVLAGGARRERLAQGMAINGRTYHFQIQEPATAAPADLVIFTVKNTQLATAFDDAAKAVGEGTIILSLLNGISSETELKKRFPQAHVLTSVIRIPSLHIGNTVTYPETGGQIAFGEERNDELSPAVRALKDLFDRAGISYKIPLDMRRDQWLKFMANVSENQVAALIGNTYRGFQTSDQLMELVILVSREVVAIARAAGIPLTEEDVEHHRRFIYQIHPEGKPSTLQDLEAGRKTEVEYFAGTVIRLGEQYGIPTPYNRFLYHAIKGREELAQI